MTLESFLAWKKSKTQEKIDSLEQDVERQKADLKAGKEPVISGREIFEFHPKMVNNEDEEADSNYIQEAGADEVVDSLGVNDQDISLYIPRDGEETGITVEILESVSTYLSHKDENKLIEASEGLAVSGESDLEEQSGGVGQENAFIATVILENLFTGEDLDELEQKLLTFDLEDTQQ